MRNGIAFTVAVCACGSSMLNKQLTLYMAGPCNMFGMQMQQSVQGLTSSACTSKVFALYHGMTTATNLAGCRNTVGPVLGLLVQILIPHQPALV